MCTYIKEKKHNVTALEVQHMQSSEILIMHQRKIKSNFQTIPDIDLRWRAVISCCFFYASFFFCLPSRLFLYLSLCFVLNPPLAFLLFPSTKSTTSFVTSPFFLKLPSVVPFGPHYQHDYSLFASQNACVY